MHPIFNAIDNNDLESFIKIFNEDKNTAALTDEGWGILSLVTDYKMNDFVDFLLENMTEEQIKEQQSKHPLLIAIENNDQTLINKFISHDKIKKHISIIKDNKKENALLYAQYFTPKEERTNLIKQLLALNCDPFEENGNMLTPVLHCIETSDIDTFEIYSKHKNFKNKYDESWVQKSIRYNNPSIFKTIFDLDKITDFDKLLKNALSFRLIETVDIILDSGNVLPGKDDIHQMIDIICEVYDDPKKQQASLNITNYLFNSGVPFSQFTNNNKNIWTLVIENDNLPIFEKLIESNETVDITDHKKHTPLFYAIEKKKPFYVKKLLEQGANVSQKDKNNNTPLIYAVLSGNKEIVDIILSYPNTLINDLNYNNQSALSIAVKNKRMDIVSSLIWKGAEINKNPVKFLKNNDIYHIGSSGEYEKLFSDIQENDINNFVALSQLGFNLNQTNDKGDTFLLQFIKEGYLANFQSLLKCSFNPNQIDSNGDSPIMCAMRKENDDYSMGLFWKFNNLDFSVINNEGENIYDIAKDFPSETRTLELIKKDDNLTFENLSKILPTLIMSINLKDNYEYFEIYQNELSDYVDSYKNNILMLSVLGNNLDNFIYILENEKFKINITDFNKNEENIASLIEKLPQEDSEKFNHYFIKYLKKNKIKQNF